jgi:hypothetical protein
VKAKVPNPTYIEHALELVGFKIAGHPTVMWPFVVIECFLDPALSRSPSGNLVERAAPALNRWRAHGVSWNQVGNHLLVFIRQKRRTGRPAGPERTTETQAAKEFELRKAGLSYQAIRDKLYPKTFGVELEAIKQRVSRYAKRHGQSLK